MRVSDKKEKIEMPAQSHQFWRDKHVFAELDELRGDKWCHNAQMELWIGGES